MARWIILVAVLTLLSFAARAQLLGVLQAVSGSAPVLATCSPSFVDTNTAIVNTSNAVIVTCAQ